MISFPFTSESGDRKVYIKDFRALFKSYFTNGVFNGGFAVTPATGMKVNVSAGWCNIEGCFGYSEDNVQKTIETVSSETYFNIVLRLDDNKANRNIDIYVVKGTSSPAQLTRNSTVYELCIARIKVGSSDTSITLDMIEDTRLKTDLCGVVASAVQVLDTDTYYNQLQGALDKFLGIVQDALDETLAGNLQNQIDACIKTTNIVDNLESTDTDKPLSANQGKYIADNFQKKSWTLLNSAGGAPTGVTKAVENLSAFNEFMLVLIYQDTRVLVTTHIPIYDLIKTGKTDYMGGAHQAYYNGDIKGGITYISDTSIKMYSNNSCIISLYAR